MNGDRVIARNYAVAFINSFIDDISEQDFLAMQDALAFWEENRKTFYFLEAPAFDAAKKISILNEVLEKLYAPESLKELFALLVRHKRVLLIRDVLREICALYKKRKNILFFTISSVHELHDDELDLIKQFLKNKTGKTILCTCVIDKSLIAGIRCRSETVEWEYSVRKQLDNLRRQLILQGST